MKEVDEQNKSRILGALFMLISNVGFLMNSITIKYAFTNRPDLTAFDVLLVRSLIMLPMTFIHAKISGVNLVKMHGRLLTLCIIRGSLS